MSSIRIRCCILFKIAQLTIWSEGKKWRRPFETGVFLWSRILLQRVWGATHQDIQVSITSQARVYSITAAGLWALACFRLARLRDSYLQKWRLRDYHGQYCSCRFLWQGGEGGLHRNSKQTGIKMLHLYPLSPTAFKWISVPSFKMFLHLSYI